MRLSLRCEPKSASQAHFRIISGRILFCHDNLLPTPPAASPEQPLPCHPSCASTDSPPIIPPSELPSSVPACPHATAGLYPAKRSSSPAHNSRAPEAEQRAFASARHILPPTRAHRKIPVRTEIRSNGDEKISSSPEESCTLSTVSRAKPAGSGDRGPACGSRRDGFSFSIRAPPGTPRRGTAGG